MGDGGGVKIRNCNVGYKYAKYTLYNNNYSYEHIKITHETQHGGPKMGKTSRYLLISKYLRSLIIADDADISFGNRNDIPIKLKEDPQVRALDF